MPMLLLHSYPDPLVSVIKVFRSFVVPNPALLLDIALTRQPLDLNEGQERVKGLQRATREHETWGYEDVIEEVKMNYKSIEWFFSCLAKRTYSSCPIQLHF